MKKKVLTISVLLGACFVCTPQPSSACVKCGISVETVNSYAPCGITPDLGNSNTSGANFMSRMLSIGLGLFNQTDWQDANVWNTDFIDPDTRGAPAAAADDLNADAPGLAVSFIQAHGIGDINTWPTTASTTCQTVSQCTSPPAGKTNGWGGGPLSTAGACAFIPDASDNVGHPAGSCEWASARAIVTCGTNDTAVAGLSSHIASISGPNMVFGENPTVGAWRGAGTNGGASMVIFHISHGMDTWFPNLEYTTLFGGVQVVATLLIAPGGDTADSAAFGGAIAGAFANTSSNVSTLYTNAISSVTDGAGCLIGGKPFAGGKSFPGGINGCGCHVTLSEAASQSNASGLNGEPLVYLTTSDRPAANGNGWMAWTYSCNYDLGTYPWHGGN